MSGSSADYNRYAASSVVVVVLCGTGPKALEEVVIDGEEAGNPGFIGVALGYSTPVFCREASMIGRAQIVGRRVRKRGGERVCFPEDALKSRPFPLPIRSPAFIGSRGAVRSRYGVTGLCKALLAASGAVWER